MSGQATEGEKRQDELARGRRNRIGQGKAVFKKKKHEENS